MQDVDCRKCKFKCSDKIGHEMRKDIFESYYKLGNYERQRDYICQSVTSSGPVRKSAGRKKESHQYYLTVHGTRIRVCKQFFLKTLDIGERTIYYNLEKKNHCTLSGTDQRGKCKSVNAISDERIQFVKKHIESFPTMASHYCRKDSKRKYLAQGLSITKM